VSVQVRLIVCVVAVVAVSACTSARSSRTAVPSQSPTATLSGSEEISVPLLHCGIKPIIVRGQVWEAPPQTTDGDPELSLDATNRPKGWEGHGAYVIKDNRMTCTDRGG
jgi:hypothetical protein